MSSFLLPDYPHRRYNPMMDEWILVSPQRANRPWHGRVDLPSGLNRPAYAADCYLCPGNIRAGGDQNPDYKDVMVFTNDFSAIAPELHETGQPSSGLMISQPEQGICRVICYSPRHNLTVAEMETGSVRKIVDAWCRECTDLSNLPHIRYIQIFENKGELMGCSNPHPHGQIWAQSSIPAIPAKESEMQLNYFNRHQKTLLTGYMEEERKAGERIIYENDHFIALVPYWATWPFETMLVAKRGVPHLTDLSQEERTGLAEAYVKIAIIYDNLFCTSFPYSAGIHQAPYDGKDHPEWHLHMHFYPPLLRSTSVKKFMVGYEMLAEPQRDITAEQSAAKLRTLPSEHYTQKKL